MNAHAGQIGVQFDSTVPPLLYAAGPLTSPPTGRRARVKSQRLSWLCNACNTTLTQGWEAAALQLAFWEIVLDNDSVNRNAGHLRVTNATDAQVVTLTNSMLLASAGQSSTGLMFWRPEENECHASGQTLFGGSSSMDVQAPESPNGFLLGGGLLLMSAIRRRRSTRA